MTRQYPCARFFRGILCAIFFAGFWAGPGHADNPAEDGVRFFVRPAHLIWAEGIPPVFIADLLHNGVQEYDVCVAPACFRLLIDGIEFRMAGAEGGFEFALAPGRHQNGIRIATSGAWMSADTTLIEHLKPGMHSVRAVVTLRPRGGDPDSASELLTGQAWFQVAPRAVLPVGDSVDDVLDLLADMTPGVFPPETRNRLVDLQPDSGNLLASLVADREHPLHERAMQALVWLQDDLSAEQLETWVHNSFSVYAEPRARYPQGCEAVIELGYRFEPHLTGKKSNDDTMYRTVSRNYLDGETQGDPFAYNYPGATTGWTRLKDLALGQHRIDVVTDYTVTVNDVEIEGSASRSYVFEIVPGEGYQDVMEVNTPELAAAVDDAFEIVWGWQDGYEPEPGVDRYAGALDPRDRPDYSPHGWNVRGPDYSLRFPSWRLKEGLPVSLCYEVAIRDEQSGRTYKATGLRVKADEASSTYFVLMDHRDFIEERDAGELPVTVTLTPSRDLALTYPDVREYFGGAMTFEHLKVNLTWEGYETEREEAE